MATVREQGTPIAPVRNDALVQGHLNRARRRIRALDLTAAGLGFVALTLAFALLVVLLDSTHHLAAVPRQLLLLGYGLTAIAYIALTLVRPLCNRVNAYYAARELERAVPEAKNSVVNWLDLHEQPLPPVIRGALAQRAARDLDQTDLDQVVGGRHAIAAGAAALTVVIGFVVALIWLGAAPLQAHLGRAFFPFGSDTLAKRTQLTLVRPVNGDAIVAIGQSVSIAVRVGGRIPDPEKPDALRLLYRYGPDDPPEEQLLEPEVADVWATILPASRTHQGFFYKVVGGDDETPEHFVTVRSGPLVESYEVTYRYRPYLGWAERTTRDANLKELRGTEAVLLVRTNREVKEGRLELEDRTGKRDLPADLLGDDPRALRFRLVLDQEGQYRVGFTSVEGEKNAARTTFTITVLPDRPPRVELTKPGADVTLPANGTLKLEGAAIDDFGLQAFTLRMRVDGGALLAPKPYREGTSFQLIDGTYPKTLDYKDFAALDELKDEAGKPFATVKGMVLEYWLEATDSCDFPGPNRAESKHFKVTVTEADPDAKRQKDERGRAAEEQKGHEKKQDEKQEGENKEREGGGGGEEPRPDAGGGGDGVDRKAEELRDALDRRADETKGEAKGEGQRPEGEPMGQAGEKCERKGGGEGEGTGEAGDAKGHGEGEAGMGEEGAAKGAGQASEEDGSQGEGKGDGRSEREGDGKGVFGESKSPPKNEGQPNGAPPCAECKGGNGAEANGACECKGGGSGSGQGQGQGSGKGGGNAQVGEGSGNATAKGVGNGGAGNQGQRREGDGTGAVRREQTTAREGSKGDPTHRRRAGVLQLEDFTKIDKKLLQELKMSEEDWKAFREAYLKKRPHPSPTAETLPPSQGGNLRNLAVREVKSGDKPQTNDARRTGLGQAPPEFRETFRQYTTGDK